jgi:predicted nucleic acid-binding protein
MQSIYLDTSVPSAVFDLGKPDRLLKTKQWFEEVSSRYDLYTSALTFDEIEELLTIEKKENILKLIRDFDFKVLEINDQAQELSRVYIQKGAIPETEPEDALHIATAVIHKIPNLASWDYKHIVSTNPVRKINELNQKFGYQAIKIDTIDGFQP